MRVIDLTQPRSERTPVIRLPSPFANTPPLSRRTLSRYRLTVDDLEAAPSARSR